MGIDETLGEEGRGVVNDVVERFGPWSAHDFYVCGKPAMVRAAMGTLARIGVPPNRIRYDTVGGDAR